MGGVDHHVRVRHLLVWIEFRIPLSHVIFSLRFYHPQELLGNASNNAVVKQELDPPIVAWFSADLSRGLPSVSYLEAGAVRVYLWLVESSDTKAEFLLCRPLSYCTER